MEIIEFINKNSKLPKEFLSDFKREEIEGVSFINNFMSKDYNCQDFQLKYSSYSNESGLKLTSIRILSNKYNILGITIGDNMEKCKKLLDLDFIEKEGEKSSLCYEKENYNIVVYIKDNIIKEITLEAEVTLEPNKLY